MFTIIMAGPPQLLDLIRSHPSLVQRVQMTYKLDPFNALQTNAYIQHHMTAAGGDIQSFEPAALDSIHQYSGGLPRKINMLCDTALMLGFAGRVPKISPFIVSQAATDTGIFAPESVPIKDT